MKTFCEANKKMLRLEAYFFSKACDFLLLLMPLTAILPVDALIAAL